jgi:hypothetical protein
MLDSDKTITRSTIPTNPDLNRNASAPLTHHPPLITPRPYSHTTDLTQRHAIAMPGALSPTSTPLELPTQPPTDATAHPDIPPFPPATTFSLLPEIYLLLSRIQLYQAQLQSTTTQPQQPSQTKNPQQPEDSLAANPLNLTPLDAAKDLAGAIYPLRQAVARAREAVKSLPGVEGRGGVEAQAREIRDLEGRVGMLRGRREALGGIVRREF